MSIKEDVLQGLNTLSEAELIHVAELVAFLKFRARFQPMPALADAQLATLYAACAHQQITREWWDARRHAFELFVSQMALDEASAGDLEAAARRLEILTPLPLLEPQAEEVALAQ